MILSNLLLNPDAQENEFVMKKMQQKAVRSHFIRPTASGSRKNCSVDLFGYGKILQFLLAYTEQIPELSRSEERRLERIIERCTGGGRRHYDKISQVIRDLPEEREEWNPDLKAAILLLLSQQYYMGSDNDNSARVSTADTFLFLRQSVETIQTTPLYPTVYYPADNKSTVLPAGNRT